MSLLAIKQHLLSVRSATLSSLCALFSAEPETVRAMLQHFIRKGCVRKCERSSACGSKCFKCPVANAERYEWVS